MIVWIKDKHGTLCPYKAFFFFVKWEQFGKDWLSFIVNSECQIQSLCYCNLIGMWNAVSHQTFRLVIVRIYWVSANQLLLFFIMKKWQCLLCSEIVNCLYAVYPKGELCTTCACLFLFWTDYNFCSFELISVVSCVKIKTCKPTWQKLSLLFCIWIFLTWRSCWKIV